MALLEIRTNEPQKAKSFWQFIVHNFPLFFSSKLRSLSMIKPCNLWCDIWVIFVVLRHSCKLAVSTRSLCCNLFPVTSNALVSSVLMYIVFSVDRFSIFSKSLERTLVKEVILLQFALKGRVVLRQIYQWWSCSNVKAYHSQIGEMKLDRGLIPAVPPARWQILALDVICPIFTNCCHPSRYDWNHATLSGLALYTDNFFNDRLWSITLKPLWKSTNTSPSSSSLSIWNKIFSMIVISAILVELPEWKADCNYLYSKLFLLKIF